MVGNNWQEAVNLDFMLVWVLQEGLPAILKGLIVTIGFDPASSHLIALNVTICAFELLLTYTTKIFTLICHRVVSNVMFV